MTKKLSQAKAIEMLKNPPHGMALTDKQQQYFTDVATAQPPPLAKMGGWLDKYNDGGPVQPNYNDAQASTGPGYVGTGYDTTGRNYSPAWGGQFQQGGWLSNADKWGDNIIKSAVDKVKAGKKSVGNLLKAGFNKALVEVADTDWGKEKLKNFGRNANPYNYDNLNATALERGINASLRNKKEPEREELDQSFKAGTANAQDSVRMDLLNRYTGLPEKYGTLKPSQFAPSIATDSNAQYFSSPQIEGMIEEKFPKTGFKTKADIEKWAADQAIYKQDPNNPGQYLPMKGKGSNYVAVIPALGSATYGAGEDEQGPYLSYSDKWDLNPYHGEYAGLHKSSETTADKIGSWLVGGDESKNIATKHIGNPTDVYGRIYFDPKTGQYKEIPRPKFVQDINSVLPSALGKKMQMGGSMPGAVGFMYSRTAGSAPDNGKYAKKTKASAQNGKEMQFYQNGLDWKPNNISRDGSVIKDDRGQWAHPGEITEIGSNNITMEGVDYPVLGVSDTGDTKLMQPGEDYKFKGKKVTEYPQAQNGWLGKYDNNQSDATRVAPKMIPLSKQQIQDNIEAARKMDLRNKVYEANPQTHDIGQYTPKEGEEKRMYEMHKGYMQNRANPIHRAVESKTASNAWHNIAEPMMDIEAGLGAGQLLKSGIKSGVNTIGRGIANESSLSNVLSNTKDQLSNALKGTNSIFGQIEGELTQGAANRKSIQEGNEWLKNWIDNPTTQAKIDNSINNQINFRNNFYSDPSLDNIELIRNQSKNFTPNSKEYSLFKQADENLQQYLGAKNRQPIHTDNWGVSYAHGYSPEERQLIEKGQKKAHNYYGSWISRDPLLSQEKRIGTTIHEGTHDWVSEEAFKKSGMRNISLANTDPTIKNNFLKWEDLRKNRIDPAAIMGKDEAYQAYLADPTEMHARTMELRKHLGINPEDIANDDYSEQVINYLKLLDKKNQPIDVNGYLNVINHKPNRLTDLLNNFWAVPPAVIATGAATSQQKKNGGWLNKYK